MIGIRSRVYVHELASHEPIVTILPAVVSIVDAEVKTGAFLVIGTFRDANVFHIIDVFRNFQFSILVVTKAKTMTLVANRIGIKGTLTTRLTKHGDAEVFHGGSGGLVVVSEN